MDLGKALPVQGGSALAETESQNVGSSALEWTVEMWVVPRSHQNLGTQIFLLLQSFNPSYIQRVRVILG